MTRPIVSIDPSLCTGCQRCHATCPNQAILGKAGQPQTIDTERCLYCGQCIQTCAVYFPVMDWTRPQRQAMRKQRGIPNSAKEPLFAAWSRNDELFLQKRLQSDRLFKVVQTAPSIQFSLGEEFGLPFGTLVTGKMVAALRRLGFDRVYSTSFTADLTIMEEATEFVDRIKNNGKLPMFTSCCSAWAKYIESFYPDLLSHLSTCKSPIQMLGTLVKTWGAEQEKIDPAMVYSVAIAPCTCKKYEAERPENNTSGFRDVDTVITTRGLARAIKEANIDFLNLPDEDFDNPLGQSSGAGNIFATTGGVIEAALRTASYLMDGEKNAQLDIVQVRGQSGVRQATIRLGGVDRKVIMVAGVQYVAPLLEQIRNNTADFDLMEVMCCPLGCISGGGQPKILLPPLAEKAREMRRKSVYELDKNLPQRRSYENPAIISLYEQYFEKPGSHIAHKLLHTHFGSK